MKKLLTIFLLLFYNQGILSADNKKNLPNDHSLIPNNKKEEKLNASGEKNISLISLFKIPKHHKKYKDLLFFSTDEGKAKKEYDKSY
jgi:hypothetical protein